MKVTVFPLQIFTPGLAEIRTAADKLETTLMEMAFEVTETPVAQLSDEVIIQVTISPLFNEFALKAELSVPASAPLICH